MNGGVEVSPFNSGLFESLSPSAHRITPTDHTAYVLIPAVCMLAITTIVVFVKVHTAWTIFRTLRMDDYALLAAMGFYVAHVVTLCMSVQHGLGLAAERLTSLQTQQLSQLYLTSNVLLYPLLACAKVAAAMLVILIQSFNFRWMMWTICAVIVAWATAGIAATPTQCSPDRWALGPTTNDNCVQQFNLQIGLKTVDMLTDIALAVVPGVLFTSLQMSRLNRAMVAFLFGLRIITPVFTLLSLLSQITYYSTPTPSRPFAAAIVSFWTSIAAGTSLITACIPSIRRFIQDYAAGVSIGIMGDGDIALSSLNASRTGRTNTLNFGTAVSKTWVQGQTHLSRSDRQKHGDRAMDDDGTDGESRRGLTTNVGAGQIGQTTDIIVHSEQAEGLHRRRHSGSLSRGSSENSLICPSQAVGGGGPGAEVDARRAVTAASDDTR